MCRVWMETVAGRPMKDGIQYLSLIGMAILAVRILLIILVSIMYYHSYAGFILIDLFAILAFFLVYQNIECERDCWIVLGLTIHVVSIFFFTFFCLIVVVWMVEYDMQFLHFLLSLMLCSLTMVFLVFDVYYVMAVTTEHCKRTNANRASGRSSSNNHV